MTHPSRALAPVFTLQQRRRWFKALAVVACTSIACAPAFSQQSAGKTVRLVVPYTPGGSTDAAARIAAQFLAKELGTNVIVENKPGANTIIATQYVAGAPSDGSIALIGGTASMTSNPYLYRRLPYDTEKAFVPVGMVSRMPFVMVVSSQSKFSSVREFVTAAKAAPAPLRYGSAGNGNPTHLAGALFSQATGVSLQQIPYQGSAPSISALLAGDTEVNFEVLSTALPHIRAGKLRALAVMSLQRNAKLPEIPTLEELGLAGLDISTSFAVVLPAATPVDVQKRLHDAVVAATSKPDFAQALDVLALEPYPPLSQADTVALFAKERARWKKVIQANSISLD